MTYANYAFKTPSQIYDLYGDGKNTLLVLFKTNKPVKSKFDDKLSFRVLSIHRCKFNDQKGEYQTDKNELLPEGLKLFVKAKILPFTTSGVQALIVSAQKKEIETKDGVRSYHPCRVREMAPETIRALLPRKQMKIDLVEWNAYGPEDEFGEEQYDQMMNEASPDGLGPSGEVDLSEQI